MYKDKLTPKERLERGHQKSTARLQLVIRLIAVAFMMFIFIMTVRPEIFSENLFMVTQLVFAIPILLTAALAMSKMMYSHESLVWDNLAFVTFTVGFAFLMNVVGILIALYTNVMVAIAYFIMIWTLHVIYSMSYISYDKSAKKERLTKDFLFITVQFLLGLLPALGLFV